MIRNNKGFMLAEIVIVSAVVIVTLVALYAGFVKLFKAYQERTDYFDTNSSYALKNIQDYFIDSMSLNTLILNAQSGFQYFDYNDEGIDTNTSISSEEHDYLKTVMSNYDIDYVLLSSFTKEDITNLSFKEDILLNDFTSYILNNENFGVSEDGYTYSYIFIAKTNEGRFAYLKGI